ncbi:transposase [Singulisphaera sp. Ch08]|uniref:Transposase n=1 Tax=Singulisphaera sp. Ch08 TaxID=3120278 RepID=A0AAU7CIL2_9BACT
MHQQQSEITYIVAYRCPNCQAALEARSSEAQTWLRCPKCGRASLPPELVRTPHVDPILPGDDVLVIGPAAHAAGLDSGEPRPSPAYSGAVRRVLLVVGILAAFMMLMTSFVERDFMNVAIYGVVAIVLLVIMGFTGARR